MLLFVSVSFVGLLGMMTTEIIVELEQIQSE